MNAALCNTAKTGTAETVSALLDHFSIQAEGRNKAMDNAMKVERTAMLGRLNDCKDIAGKVIERLAVLNQFFEFYQYTRDMANFRPETIPGLCIVIDDCIDELKEIVS